MTAARVLLMLAGLGLAGYGATLLWDNPTPILIRIVVWALAGVVLHDFVFAPICAALGLVGRRWLPPRWQVPVAIAVLGGVVLGLLAVPVLGKPGMRPDNLTVLDRDYPLGLLLSLSVVLLALLWYLLGIRLLPVRQDEVVEQQRAERVEG
jgi:uncharacterized integral membrane protein